jgi:hypothetical protein
MKKDIYFARIGEHSFYLPRKEQGLEGEIRMDADNFNYFGIISAERPGVSLSEKEAILEAIERKADIVVRVRYPEGGKFATPNAYACFTCKEGVLAQLLERSRPLDLSSLTDNPVQRAIDVVDLLKDEQRGFLP